MLVTVEGMVIDDKPVQFWKAALAMLTTHEDIATEVKFKQSEKADSPILVHVYIMSLILIRDGISTETQVFSALNTLTSHGELEVIL